MSIRTARDPAASRFFILEHTRPTRVEFVPEVVLQLATAEATTLWQATESWLRERDVDAPFWAFAWAGGLALARYILDHPEAVRGLRVIDFASGSGLVAIACAKAGAKEVVAIEIDPLACEAIAINADLNGVRVAIDPRDRVGEDLDGEVIVAGDIWYERAAADRFEPWLRGLARNRKVLLGDPGRAYVPRDLTAVAEYLVPTLTELESRGELHARVGAFDLNGVREPRTRPHG